MNDWHEQAKRALARNPPQWRKYLQCLRVGAVSGDAEAMYGLGLWLLEGRCDERGRVLWRPDPQEAVRWLEASALLGHDLALHSLAHCYDHGEGVPKDKGRAIALYKRAIRAGSADSAVNLAICYREAGNERAYRRWIERAADNGNPEAILQFAEWRLTRRTSREQQQRAMWSLRRLIRRIRAASDPSTFYEDDLPRAEDLLRTARSRS